MRLASFSLGERSTWGLVLRDGLLDLGKRMPMYPTLHSMLTHDQLSTVRENYGSNTTGSDYPLEAISFDPVIVEPGLILCIGLNYEEHREEVKRPRATHPTVFARSPRSQVGHGRPLIRPSESAMFDYEGELAIIIGRTCRRVPEADALSVIAGYACYNDASVRDYQRHSSQWHPGKNWPATGAFGPSFVTTDEVPDPTALTISTRLNGDIVQAAGLDQLIFSLPELIAYCSTWTELHPGDVIVTGTPGGVGSARTPPLWMADGDLIEVEIPGVGVLTNPVLNETGTLPLHDKLPG